MSNNFVVLPPNWSPETNFWDFNGQLSVIPPFDKIYKIDNGGEKSSKMMTMVFFMSEVDDDKNRFARIPAEERQEMLVETYYPDANFKDKLLVKAMEAYPDVCMSAIARTLKDTKDFLQRRSAYLRSIEYNLNTMKDLDNAMAKSEKIYADFERIEKKFVEKEKTGRIRGGRAESAIEKKML